MLKKENTYLYSGIEGFLIKTSIPELQNVIPVDVVNGVGFYSLSTIRDTGILELLDSSVIEYTEDDSYEVDVLDKEIVIAECTSLSNERKLQYGWWGKEWANNDLYERELLVRTNNYYDWSSKRTEFINDCINNHVSQQEAEVNWNAIVDTYKGMNCYSDNALFQDVWNEITL